MWIDSHCHITYPGMAEIGDIPALLDNAAKAGVGGMVVINCRIVEELPVILKAVSPHNNLWCTVGTHPHEASNQHELPITKADIVALVKDNPKIVGIGETGLDYFYNYGEREDQEKSFRKHIQACLETALPIIIHARDADDDVIKIIREETGGKGMEGIMHCFSSSAKMAEEALELGFHISFSGMLTFKKMQWLRDIAKTVPLARLLVETDSPYLAPEPYRGKTNQPSYVIHTGECLADIHGKTALEMAAITTGNFFKLFKRAVL